MPARHSWSAGVDPRPDFPTSVHGRRVLEDRRGDAARLVVPRPGGGDDISLPGSLHHYRMADGADDIEFTGDEVDLELLCDHGGEWAWLRATHFHRAERHGLSWLRHRLVTARVRLSPGWSGAHPAWACHDESGGVVAQLIVCRSLIAGPEGSEGEAGLRGLLADFLDGPPAEPEPGAGLSGPSG